MAASSPEELSRDSSVFGARLGKFALLSYCCLFVLPGMGSEDDGNFGDCDAFVVMFASIVQTKVLINNTSLNYP